MATLSSCGPFDELTGTEVDTIGEVPFENRLAIPPLADSELDSEGRRVFTLTAEPGERALRPGGSTETWGFNGSYLGPTLRATRGEEVRVDFENGLDEATTVHWHGMHLPADADGGPHQIVEPGETWTPSWEIDQPAATLWYHPHLHGDTEAHVYRGLAGMFILDDSEEAELDLPREYGVDDVPVIVQDKLFAEDGSLVEDDREELGILGDTVLVNGTYGPFLDVSTERVRLRLLNGSTARTYDFGFSGGRDFALIATDGGLLERPAELDRIQLSPGERAEIVVTIEPRERVVLRSYPPDLEPGSDTSREDGGEDSFDVLQLRAAAELDPSAAVPSELADVSELDPGDAAVTREFELRSRRINGEEMDIERIDEVVEVDTTEVWEVENGHGQPHTFHVHDVQFQVLDVDGEDPPPDLSGWKDTIQLPPGMPVRLIMRFEDYADPDAPYMYHCHLLRHEDEGMMAQFVVVEPGEDAAAPPAHGEIGHNQDHG
ncbi:MAG TPA: multicopper oxidase domain-containing protein [Solirubrobacterales bacterium]|nr:multicopper oxidase domain-containing protein [Solirubrobacterales bacterium]